MSLFFVRKMRMTATVSSSDRSVLVFDRCSTQAFWSKKSQVRRPEVPLAVPLVYRGSFHGEVRSEDQGCQDRRLAAKTRKQKQSIKDEFSARVRKFFEMAVLSQVHEAALKDVLKAPTDFKTILHALERPEVAAAVRNLYRPRHDPARVAAAFFDVGY